MYALRVGKRRFGVFDHFSQALAELEAKGAEAIEQLGVGIVYVRLPLGKSIGAPQPWRA